MLRDYRTVRAVAAQIGEAAEITIQGYRDGKFTDEPHITDRLMGTIEERVRNFVGPVPSRDEPDTYSLESLASPTRLLSEDAYGHAPELKPLRVRRPLIWEAATLRTGRGVAAEEKQYGADILGVLSVDTPEYAVDKGFLAQAKRAEPGVFFSKGEWNRLVGQCNDMLAISRDSYVVAYSKERGVRLFSAQAVSSFSGRDLFDLYHIAVQTFFERHIESFIGDIKLNEPNLDVLRKLQDARDDPEAPGNVLHLMASEMEV